MNEVHYDKELCPLVLFALSKLLISFHSLTSLKGIIGCEAGQRRGQGELAKICSRADKRERRSRAKTRTGRTGPFPVNPSGGQPFYFLVF